MRPLLYEPMPWAATRPPRWLYGERLDRALAAIKGQQEFWSRDQVDPRSGEVLTAADFGKAPVTGLTLPGGTISTESDPPDQVKHT